MAISYKFKVGDSVVRISPDGGCELMPVGAVGVIKRVNHDFDSRGDLIDVSFNGTIISLYDFRFMPAEKPKKYCKEYKGETTMGIASKIKELALSSDERLLRRVGLKDSDGEWTDEATEVLNDILLEERKGDIIAKAKEVEAEEKKAKKESK